MIYSLDSSVLVKRFVQEAGSPRVRQLMRGRGRLATSSLANVEMRSAVARLTREGLLDETEAKRALSHLDGVWPSLTIVEARGRTLELPASWFGGAPYAPTTRFTLHPRCACVSRAP